ncbi:MAG TPA: hypothetical protein VFB06_13015 [Streptosporangiaceae bacterium]|nr:hypothetical protein [Streptosporangiaceae bacterium]
MAGRASTSAGTANGMAASRWESGTTAGQIAVTAKGRPRRRSPRRSAPSKRNATKTEPASPASGGKSAPGLEHWVKTIAAPPTVSENTQAGYEVDVRKHLVPGVGAHWLDKLDAEHLEKLYARLLESGLSAGTVNHVHRTVRASLDPQAP